MGQLVPRDQVPKNLVQATPGFTSSQIELIRRTVAKDTNNAEFDLFITVARRTGLDPFRKQIAAVVFNKAKADKRSMSIITQIDGLRAIAARSGRYRPDEDEPVYEIDPDEKGPLNPKGIVKATVTIWIADAMRQGGWKPVKGVARWEEFAPLKDEWEDDPQTGKGRRTGRQTLDTGGNWGRMPFLMIAKCAEAQALRKAFPEDTSGLYEAAEMDRARMLDTLEELSPSQIVEQSQAESRQAQLGGPAILFQFFPNSPLEGVPMGQIFDRVAAFLRECGGTVKLDWFIETNRRSLQDFWAYAKGDALELKEITEARRAVLAEEEAKAAEEDEDEEDQEAVGDGAQGGLFDGGADD